MFAWYHTVTTALHGGLNAIQQELRALERDLGLCAECGEARPVPLRPRRSASPRARLPTVGPVPAPPVRLSRSSRDQRQRRGAPQTSAHALAVHSR
jgi:hypothetical protein